MKRLRRWVARQYMNAPMGTRRLEFWWAVVKRIKA